MNSTFELSICLIVRNEEKNLRTCLKRIKQHISCTDLKYEILVVDTGSDDGTIDVADEYHARIEHFEWISDFAAARNYAMEKAEYNKILFLDADEFIEDLDIKEICRLGSLYPDSIGRMLRRNLCNNGENGTCIINDRVERFFDKRIYHYEGCIHEQVVRIDGKKPSGYPIPMTVYHEGYMGTKEQLKAKAERNNILLYKELEKHPEDPYIFYQLGQSYGLMGDSDNEYESYKKGYQLNPDRKAEYTAMMITSLGKLMIKYEPKEKVLEYINEEKKSYKEYADFLCFVGYAYMTYGLFEKAINMYELATKSTMCHLDGDNSYRAYHNIGCIYEALGDEIRAISYLEQAGDYAASKEKIKIITANKDFYEKKVSIVISITSEDNIIGISGIIDSLQNQSMGMGHIEVIFAISGADPDIKKKIYDFEKVNEKSVIILDNMEDEKTGVVQALSYTSTDKIVLLNQKTKPSFDALRLLSACIDATKADIIACDINYADAEDFLLDIENYEKREIVRKLNIFDNKDRLRMYNADFLFSKNIAIEELLKCECEKKYAEKIYCIKSSYIN